jgi:hypothetical protein
MASYSYGIINITGVVGNAYKIQVRKPEGTDHFEDLSING